MIKFLKQFFRIVYRNSDTGRFIGKDEYDRLPENQRTKSRIRWRF